MRVLVTGGTGFIGGALCRRLADAQYSLVVLSRNPARVRPPALGIAALDEVAGGAPFDAVINLAGEPIARGRWTSAQRSRIRDSRIAFTETLVDWVCRRQAQPSVWINASAVGFYGIAEVDDEVVEADGGDDSFSSGLCRAWEQSVSRLAAHGVRICLLRLGVVLGADGGALDRMLPAFRLGLGGRLGSGRQWMPWIHRDDVLDIIERCLTDPTLAGPINCVAPEAVTNATFTRALGAALRRPTPAHMPAWMVRLLFGQMGEELLLHGRRVVPQRLLAAGYPFRFPELAPALRAVL